jgi:hypothetical protein
MGKATKACPSSVLLDLPKRAAIFGHGFPLERLLSRLVCPSCGTRSLDVEWIVQPDSPAPRGPPSRRALDAPYTERAWHREYFRYIPEETLDR